MSIRLVNITNDKLEINVSYILFSTEPFKTVNKQTNYKLDKKSLNLLNRDVNIDYFQTHASKCVKLFIEDAKQHLKINNIKLVYLLTAVNNKNNCICILIISTDFYFCKSPLDVWKRDNDDILKDFTDFRIYSYNLKKKEMGIYLSN